MSDMDFDFSELDKLAVDAGEVPTNSGPKFVAAVHRTSMSVKEAWADKLKGSPGLNVIARTVSYDLSSFQGFGASVLEAEIGPTKGGAGNLATISEFGNSRHPARGFGRAALEENQDDFEKGITAAIDDALKESGL